MKHDENLRSTIELTDVQIVEVEASDMSTAVYRDVAGKYHVVRDGFVRHPDCSAEDVMRALGNYLQSASFSKKVTVVAEVRRLKPREDTAGGAITGEMIAQRMMKICGCRGRHDCDCVSIENQARQELWSEHNQARRAAAGG